MSIDPAGRYEAVTFYYPRVVWTIQGPLSGDLVAGLLTGILVITQYLAKTYGADPNDISVDVLGDEKLTGATTGILEFYQFTETKEPTLEQLLTNNFGWWIYHAREETYRLYEFQTPEFMQGFISIVKAFGLDFRQFVMGPPYKFSPEAKEPIIYNITDYDIEPFPQPKRGAPVGAFYTAEHEADPGGVDYE